ncbi:MAG: phosphate ABC transporter permease subunit PstC [Firmicutes bacterium]|nr:phosphate ABC transporter permease subunit PstC [Bacillota bacterium]
MNHIGEKLMRGVFFLSATISIIAVVAICYFLFVEGSPAFEKVGLLQFLGGKVWKPLENHFGIFTMIVGSLYVTAGAILIGVPIGLLSAIFMAKYCPRGLYRLLKPTINLLAAVPSIVYGFFGLMAIVPAMQGITGTNGKGVLTASIVLGIMILPTIISVSESALRAVPETYYDGALALGATPEYSVFFVCLPAAKSGILSAVVLGIGRAIGETMAVVMVAGNSAVIPEGVTSMVRTMTANIVLEMGYAAEGLHRQALIATAVVLFVFILIINVSLSMLKERKS